MKTSRGYLFRVCYNKGVTCVWQKVKDSQGNRKALELKKKRGDEDS